MKIGAYYRAVRLRKWKEQGGCCRYCGQPTAYFGTKRPKTWPHFPRNEATLDHVIPISLGGARDPQVNCVIACRACNQERGNKDARLFEFEKQGLIPPPAQAAHGMRN